MQLYLITHAHTAQNRQTEATQWQLSDQGRQQATMLARQPFWAEVEQIVLSREPKTYLTVEPVIAQRGLPVLRDARFDELLRPGWTEDYTAQVRQAFAQPAVAAGAWEPATAALTRFLAGISELCQRFPQNTLALVGHGLTLSLYRAYLLGKPQVDLAEWRQLSFAAVALVDPLAKTILKDFQPVAGQLARG
ncbi:MAG: histidine phosphatase family protein [Caldilineaceae bacterium]